MWLIFGEIDQSKIRAVTGSFKRKNIMSENCKVILTSHIIHSCSWRIQGRETQQILFTTYCDVWQLLLSKSSSVFQTHPLFSVFNLIHLDPKSGKINPFFLSFLSWKWYYPVSCKSQIATQFPFPHELGERGLVVNTWKARCPSLPPCSRLLPQLRGKGHQGPLIISSSSMNESWGISHMS